jgi:hypothetical protein
MFSLLPVEVTLFLSTYLVVFSLGAQSLLVNNGRYEMAFMNSLVIGSCNLALFKFAPDATGLQVAAFLLGGPFGIVSAMWTFRHLHRTTPKPKQHPRLP